MERAAIPAPRSAVKMHPMVHLVANLVALVLLVSSLLSGHGLLALAGIGVFLVYCAVESWSVARHRRDLL
jgi:hypothetical protein